MYLEYNKNNRDKVIDIIRTSFYGGMTYSLVHTK
jgi:hypothetical protein